MTDFNRLSEIVNVSESPSPGANVCFTSRNIGRKPEIDYHTQDSVLSKHCARVSLFQSDAIVVDDDRSFVEVQFTPTIPHCRSVHFPTYPWDPRHIPLVVTVRVANPRVRRN